MSVGPLEGAFLRFLVALKQPRRVLEIGVFTGWSSIEMATALPPGATIVACDVNPETTAMAKRYAEEAGVADRIDYRVGDAFETIQALEGPFDLVFLDAWKSDYIEYYEAAAGEARRRRRDRRRQHAQRAPRATSTSPPSTSTS